LNWGSLCAYISENSNPSSSLLTHLYFSKQQVIMNADLFVQFIRINAYILHPTNAYAAVNPTKLESVSFDNFDDDAFLYSTKTLQYGSKLVSLHMQ